MECSATSLEPFPTSYQDVGQTSFTKAHISSKPPISYIKRSHRYLKHFIFEIDHRSRLHPFISRFLGFRRPGSGPPYDPLPFAPFTWLSKISLEYEVRASAWVGTFGGILLIEAIMSTHTVFHDVYHVPIIFNSFGALAVLLFGAIESPLAQPRHVILGQLVSAVVATAITRLFVLNVEYTNYLSNITFYAPTFINGALSTATALLGQQLIGAVHPPAGATALIAAVQASAVPLSWHFIPTILTSSLIMLAWALIINNLGRRRYPVYWWHPGPTLVSPTADRIEEGFDSRTLTSKGEN